MNVKPLYKEVAFTGNFVDVEGREVELTEALFQQAVTGTAELMDAGFNIRGYSSHFTSDSKDVMGTWSVIEEGSGKINGIFQAIDNDNRNRAKQLDTSMVIEEDIDIGNGRIIPVALTRIDIVGQGAIVGTQSFREMFSRFQTKRNKATDFSSKRCLHSVAPKGPKMAKLSIGRGLAKALGLAIDEDVGEEVLEEMVVEKLGLSETPADEREAAMSLALSKAFMVEEEEEEEKDEEKKAELAKEDDPEDPDEYKKFINMAEEDKKKSEMSKLQRRVASLEDDKIDGLLQTVPEEKRAGIKKQFGRFRAKAGFDLALESIQGQVDAYSESALPGVALSQFRTNSKTQIAKRPKNTRAPQGENLLMAAARRKGLIQPEKSDSSK